MLPSGRVRLRRRAWCRSINARRPVDLGVVGQRGELPGQSDRLGREVDVAGVALVEHEVQHAHHGARVAGTVDAGLRHGALGPADALRHGGFGHEVRLRDLAGGEAAHGPERERDRRRRREVGMRAQEVEAQRVVGAGHRRRSAVRCRSGPPDSRRDSLRSRHVEEGSPRDGDEPPRRIGGWLVTPRGERSDERLLDRVLGRREVGAATDEDAQHPRDEPAELDVVHGHSVTLGGAAMNGRTSSHS